jgi:hypothetical protein
MFIMRFVVFDLQESSKYLVAKGRDEEAIQVRHLFPLVLHPLDTHRPIELGSAAFGRSERSNYYPDAGTAPVGRRGQDYPTQDLMADYQKLFHEIFAVCITLLNSAEYWSLLTSSRLGTMSDPYFQEGNLRPTPRSLSYCGVRTYSLNITTFGQSHTHLIVRTTGLIGLAFPLFNGFLPLYLKQRVSGTAGFSATYRNYTIISILGIPGSLIACVAVDWTRNTQSRWSFGGRKFTMAISTLLTGIFLFLFTTSKTNAAVLGYSCASSLTQFVFF